MCSNKRRTSWIVKYVHSFHSDSLFVAKLEFGGNLSKKVIGHFLIIGQIINIDLTLIGDFKELSATLSISKIKGKLLKIIVIKKFYSSPPPPKKSVWGGGPPV